LKNNSDISNRVSKDVDGNITTRLFCYKQYDILGNFHGEEMTQIDNNKTIRYKIRQLNHNELKKLNLV
jgi:hypothetical protein